MGVTAEQITAGQAVYSKQLLCVYDVLVLGLSSRLIWQCPAHKIETLYNRHVTANHLDVGIGTGYFVDRCRFPAPAPRIALMDLNPDTLDFCARRIARYHPETYRRNVLAPIAIDAEKFDSVGISYLLHCLPGTMDSKSATFDHLTALMKPDAVIFGATLLQDGVTHNWLAKRLMRTYNDKGVFSNKDDHLDDLVRNLQLRFSEVSVEISGSAALFSARV